MNRRVKQRKQTLITTSKVALKLDGLQVACDGNKASAKFKQDFKLTGFKGKKVGNNTSCEVCNMKLVPVVKYASNADKELQFERINNKWQIVRELTIQ